MRVRVGACAHGRVCAWEGVCVGGCARTCVYAYIFIYMCLTE